MIESSEVILRAERNPDGTITVDGKRYELSCKRDIRQFCRERRCWAAKDKDGWWYCYTAKPVGHTEKFWLAHLFIRSCSSEEFYFPVVPWDKSLMAPDGRLILIEPKPEKAKKTAVIKLDHWYRRKHPRPSRTVDRMAGRIVMLQRSEASRRACTEEYDEVVVYVAPNIAVVWPIDDLYEVPAPKTKHWNPKRGEAIFAWDDDCDARIPAPVVYFAGYNPGVAYTINSYSITHYGVSGTEWVHMRKYDPALVGVPRKDWPKAAEGDEM